jgi:hypothetical protein
VNPSSAFRAAILIFGVVSVAASLEIAWSMHQLEVPARSVSFFLGIAAAKFLVCIAFYRGYRGGLLACATCFLFSSIYDLSVLVPSPSPFRALHQLPAWNLRLSTGIVLALIMASAVRSSWRGTRHAA